MHLDLNTQKYDSQAKLEFVIDSFLREQEALYGLPHLDDNFGPRFDKVIKRAYEKTGLRVVILVDEYDKPMLQAIENKELQEEYRATLKGFYGALKSAGKYSVRHAHRGNEVR